jgi:hypothetical protein
LLRPYPQFGDINTTNNDGKSWYNSFQVALNKRFTKGNTVGIAYTYSHWEQATEYLNAGDPEPTRMLSDLDAPHRVAVSAIVEMPFGKGRKFMSDAHPILEGLFGGWQVQGVYSYQTGFPLNFTAADYFYNGAAIDIDNPTTSRWFDPSGFTSVVNGASANASTPINHRRSEPFRYDDARRDSINNLDISVLKNFSLGGETKLQLKADFTNALNEPYFLAPALNPQQTTFTTINSSNQANYARRAQLSAKIVF